MIRKVEQFSVNGVERAQIGGAGQPEDRLMNQRQRSNAKRNLSSAILGKLDRVLLINSDDINHKSGVVSWLS